MKFRKKPVIVEATQWFKNGDHPDDYSSDIECVDQDEHPYIVSAALARERDWEGAVVRRFRRPDIPGAGACKHCEKPMNDHGWIDTLEGGHIVCPGDWIITGVNGERYPCKPDIFEKTYEAAEWGRRHDRA
jgi:hypothetical protein